MEKEFKPEKVSVFYCEKCHYNTCCNSNYLKHLSTQKHKSAYLETQGNEYLAKFVCNTCNYCTNKISNYKTHLSSEKHKKNTDGITIRKNTNKCEHCDKEFTTKSGLWKHRKKCIEEHTVQPDEISPSIDNKQTNNIIDNKISITNNIPMSLILEVIKQSKEIQNVLIEQTKELQHKLLEKEDQLLEKENKLLEQNKQILEQNAEHHKQIIELAKKPSMVNSNNTQFNLNFFLNETCKNAMNIQDFIQSIKLTTQDFETTGRLGFVDGISRIFINELKRLEVERRPLHCTDVKRETVYIKDNDTWEKENQEKKKLKWAINSIAQLNLNQVQEWQQKYPECKENNTTANTHFNEIAMVALGGFGDEQETKYRDKIMKNVLREIVISKDI
jgi:hypothetical protein